MPQAQFYDRQGKPIPEEQLAQALASGEAQVRRGQKVYLHKDGRTIEVDGQDVGQYLGKGYGVSTGEHIANLERRREAGEETGLALLEGLGEGATFGLSTKIGEELSPGYAEEAALRAQENPWAHGIGEAGGIVAPALLSGGSSLVGSAARLTPAGALARASTAVGGKVGAKLIGTGASRTVATGADFAVAGALEGAGSQAAYNATELPADQDLTVETLLAGVPESALLGSALGGLLGAGVGKLSTKGHILPEVARATDTMGEVATQPGLLRQVVSKAVAKANSAVTGNNARTIEKVLSDSDIAARLIRKDEIVPKIASKVKDDLKKVGRLREVTKKLTQQSTKADNVRSLVPEGALPAASAQAQDAVALSRSLRDPAVIERVGGHKGELTKLADSTEVRISKAIKSGDAADIRAALENTRQDYRQLTNKLQKKSTSSGLSTTDQDAATFAHELAEESSRRLDDALGNPQVWGGAAEAYKTRQGLNAKVSESGADYRTLTSNPESFYRGIREGDGSLQTVMAHLDEEAKMADNLIHSGRASQSEVTAIQEARESVDRLRAELTQHGTQMAEVNALEDLIRAEQDEMGGLINTGLAAGLGAAGLDVATLGLGAAGKMAHSLVMRPGSFARRLGAMKIIGDKMRRVDNTITKSVRRHLSQAKTRKPDDFVPEAPKRKLGTAARALPASLAVMGKTAAERRKKVEEKLDTIEVLTKDPLMQAQYASQVMTRGLYDIAPELATSVTQAHTRALQFINSKMPPMPQPHPLQPHLNKRVLSNRDVERMSRYIAAIEKPMSVLEDWEDGNLSREGVEAIKAVYPKLFERMRQEVAGQLAETTKPLPISEERQLSILLELPGSHFQTGGFLRRQQARYGMGKEEQGKPPAQMNPSQAQKVAESSMTRSEQLETRL